MDKTKGKKLKSNSWIFLLLIFIATCFMSIGYAAIDSIKGEISGTLLAQAQEGVFITDMAYVSDVNAVPDNFKIESLYQTLLGSKIQLGYYADSSITYSITVHNSSNIDYYFKETIYDQDSQYYDNSDIIFSLNNIACGDKLLKGQDITFDITFKYKEGLSTITNTILNSFIKFVFVPAEEVNKVILAYNGEDTTYLLPKDSQEGVFSNVTVDSGVVVRCNNGAVPTFSNNNVGFTNVTGETICQVFNSLKEAVESSDTTTNNYLMIANENPTQGMSVDSGKTANIDINGKTIDYKAGSDICYIYNNGTLKVSDKIGTGLLKVDYRCIRNVGKLTIDSGNYQREESSSTAGGIICSDGGTVNLSNSKFTVDKVFAIYATGNTEQTMHIENCTISSESTHAVVNWGPKTVISIANSNIISGSAGAIRSFNTGPTYICNSTVRSGNADFSYSSSGKLYYASNVTFKNGNNTPTVNGDSSYAVKNYTTTTSVDWYFVRDSSGTKLKYSDGTNIKVGDNIRIVSRVVGDYTFVCDVNGAALESGTNIQIYQNNNTTAQQFTLLASASNNYYNIAPYAATSLYLNISGATGENGANIMLYNGSDATNERFTLVKSNEDEYYYLRSSYGTSIDVDGGTPANYQNIQSWEQNETDAQKWKLEKNSFVYLEDFGTWKNYTTYNVENISCSNGIIELTSTSNDPIVEMYNVTSFDPKEHRYIDVKYRTTSKAGNMEFYMIENPSDETYAISKSLNCDGNWHIVTFDLWSKDSIKSRDTITGWRWDFATVNGATLDVDYIRIRKDT